MANVLGELFGDIADAIRSKTGEAGKMKPAAFPDAIRAIETGGDTEIIDGVDPYYQQLAEVLMTRKTKYLGSDNSLDLKGFKMSDGNTLATLSNYCFAGFGDMETMTLSDVLIVNETALQGNSKLKILDITASAAMGAVGFYPGSLTGCDALESIIIRDGGGGVTTVGVQAEHGSTANFYVYVPSEYYDTIVSGVTSTNISADRYRKLEDYPDIDNWNKTYTVRFWDGDTLVDTQTVQHGKTATSTYSKSGYKLVEWSPAPTNVTEDIDCYGWWVPATLEAASWEEIKELTTAGKLSSVYKVGDTKSDVLTYADGTTEEIEWVIAKIRSDGTAALVANHALSATKQMHSSYTYCVANYYNNDLGQYLLNTVAPAFSAELSAVLRKPRVLFDDRPVRLLTKSNVTAPTYDNSDVTYEGLTLFTSDAKRVRKLNGTAITYWLGTYTASGSRYLFDYVDESGVYKTSSGAAAGVTATRGIVIVIDV